MNRALLATLVAGLASAASAAAAQDINGVARVINGGTIGIGAQTIRLTGLAAPEPGQRCERSGQSYDCGQEAAWALAERLGRHWVLCVETGREPDGVIQAICYLGGRQGIDVNVHMVRQGWATAVPGGADYAKAEAAARRERRGLWAGSFPHPTQFRSR